MAIRTTIVTIIETNKNLSKTQILYDNLSNNRERRLPIAAAARTREASSSTARSTRSGCLRAEGEREASPTSSSTFRAFLARNPQSKKKIRKETSPEMAAKTFVFNVGKKYT
jgi:hypothetical protein